MELIYFLVFMSCFFPTLPAQQNQQIYDYLFMVRQNPSPLYGTAPWGIHGIWAEKLVPLVGPSPQSLVKTLKVYSLQLGRVFRLRGRTFNFGNMNIIHTVHVP